MSFHLFLAPAYVLQTIVLALSIFNLVAFLWLAMTVWLNGDRKSGIARLGVVGLGLSALFSLFMPYWSQDLLHNLPVWLHRSFYGISSGCPRLACRISGLLLAYTMLR